MHSCMRAVGSSGRRLIHRTVQIMTDAFAANEHRQARSSAAAGLNEGAPLPRAHAGGAARTRLSITGRECGKSSKLSRRAALRLALLAAIVIGGAWVARGITARGGLTIGVAQPKRRLATGVNPARPPATPDLGVILRIGGTSVSTSFPKGSRRTTPATTGPRETPTTKTTMHPMT